jgi:hypothetical protein
MYSCMVCVPGGLSDLLPRSWRRPKVDPTGAGQDGGAQKAPQATFSNEQGAAWYGNTVDGIGG